MNDFKRNAVLYSLMTLRYQDEQLLDIACEQIIKSKGTTAQTLTNLLYILAKSKYEPNELFLKKSVAILKSEHALPVDIACRNLWNFQQLNFYDKDLFDKFGGIIVKDFDQMSEVDVANSLSSFARFKHMGTE